MIVSVRGTLEAKGPEWAHVRVGGVSLQIFVPSSTSGDLGGPGEEVQLYTHLQIREEEAVLYGFSSLPALQLFRKLTTVTGVGPKTALALLSSMRPESLATVIATGDVNALMAVRGIGRKGAERIVLELRDKLDMELAQGAVVGASSTDNSVVSALMALGYTAQEARRAVSSLSDARNLSLEEKVRKALQGMAR